MVGKESRKLRKQLEQEFSCLKEFGVTEEELEALYESCGWKPNPLLLERLRRASLMGRLCRKCQATTTRREHT